jgi:enterochelin esterase-like enzyme
VPAVPVKSNQLPRLVAALACSLLAGWSVPSHAATADWQRIHSPQLQYDLQYQAVPSPGYQPGDPVLYVTDGAWYADPGQLPELIKQLRHAGKIRSLLLVLVDARDPADLSVNRRHQQFMCNQQYAAFFRDTLLPAIQTQYQPSTARTDRVILGLSFGAINAACFGLLLPNQFGNLAMQSPGNKDHLAVLTKLYQQQPLLPLKMSLSFGTLNDNLGAGRKFHQTLQQKGYAVAYQEVRFGHNWHNWQPLLDDVLLHFFPAGSAPATDN